MSINTPKLKRFDKDQVLLAMLKKMGYSPSLAQRYLPQIKNKLSITPDDGPKQIMKKVNEKALQPDFIAYMNQAHNLTHGINNKNNVEYTPEKLAPLPTPSPGKNLDNELEQEYRLKPLPTPFNTTPWR